MSRFAIGIDLGTTNCVLAWSDLREPGAAPKVFSTPQWSSPGQTLRSETLPSFLYRPTDAEREGAFSGTQEIPPPPGGWVPGVLARGRMGETPGRVVHSAKSWLSHGGVDRTAAILPWQSEDLPPEERLSPLQASATYLAWMRQCWDALMASADPQALFEAQEVVVTVPASFDEAAQQLTLEAAKEAGFPEVRLIEEPQAAFYDWLGKAGNAGTLLDLLQSTEEKRARILVCDIGGGTTDFSLFEAVADRSAAGGLSLTRVAVSEHLLLGGDNIDLTLAHLLEERLTGGGRRLTGRQLNQLLVQARELKERILGEASHQEDYPVTLSGAGAGLFAATLSGRVEAQEVRRIVLDGFFPEVSPQERPRQVASGLREWGLPYAADTAVTRHLAGFLEGRRIDAVLFNGGTVTPDFLRERLHRLLTEWQGGKAPTVLANRNPALSVARGAARYGALLRHPERSQRISGGHAHALYLEVIRGRAKGARSLVCVLPRGLEAGHSVQIENAEFDLRVNQPVRFQAYYSFRREGDLPGAVLPWNDRDFRPLPPLQTAIHLPPDRPRPPNDRLRVSLEAALSELGLLRLWCVEEDGPGRWRLDFNLRRGLDQEEPAQASEAPLVPEEQLRKARDLILALYAKKKNPDLPEIRPRRLMRHLEEALGGPRDQWDSATLRALWPTIVSGMGRRARSVEHEEAWLYLAGYALRPGYGFELDEARVEELWRLFSQGMAHPREKRVQVQWFLLWRRVAGGLNAGRQEKVLDKILPRLSGGQDITPEVIYLAGSLERLPARRKAELVQLLTTGLLRPRVRTREPYAWALGRLLARSPLYAGLDAVFPPERVVALFERLKSLDWREPDWSSLPPLFAQAARRTEQRGVDLPEEDRRSILIKMKETGAHPDQIRVVREHVPLDDEDRVRQFGESLPGGLILVREER